MSLPSPHFLVNFKVYPGTAGEDGLGLARTIESVADETGATFAVAPQVPDLRLAADAVDLPVVAQAVDPVDPGRGTGALAPETLVRAGADAALVNHAERRARLDEIAGVVRRCREAGLETIVSVDGIEQGRGVAALDPDWLLFEKPEDVESDRSLAREDPDRLRAFVETIDDVAPDTRVMVGGGVTVGEDVRRALELGADAAGAASAVTTAEAPADVLRGFATAMVEGR